MKKKLEIQKQRRLLLEKQIKEQKVNCYFSIYFAWCQDSSVVRFLHTDPMVSGSSPTSAKLSLRVRRVASSL